MSDNDPLVQELRAQLQAMAEADFIRQIADLERQNKELREAIDALLQPAPSELLSANFTHPSRIKRANQ